MQSHYCYINGAIQAFKASKINLNEVGLLRGMSIFEYFRTYRGNLFALMPHLDRFIRSADRIGLPLEKDRESLVAIIEELLYLAPEPRQDVAFRMILSGGYTEDGSSLDHAPNLFIWTEDIPLQNEDYYRNGVKVIRINYQREFAEIKSTNYLSTYLFQKQKTLAAAQDILYYQQGEISECSRANFFIFKGNTLVTPDKGILFGITRQLVIDLAREHYPVEERPIKMEELKEANEAFKTGTRTEIMPIVQIDDQLIASGKIGPHTQTLMQAFAEKIRLDCHGSK